MTEATHELPSHERGETPLSQIEPFNLRLTDRPLRCLTGVTIPPGLVGFCWETPLCLDVLEQQAPDLARIVRRRQGSAGPTWEERRSIEEPSRVHEGR